MGQGSTITPPPRCCVVDPNFFLAGSGFGVNFGSKSGSAILILYPILFVLQEVSFHSKRLNTLLFEFLNYYILSKFKFANRIITDPDSN
jgi:hypothetical protein